MTRQKLTIGAVATAFALGLTPAWADQDKGGQAGARPNSSGSSTGSAAPRGGDTGSSSSGSSGATSSTSGSSGSMGSSGSSSMGSGGYAPRGERAPQRPNAYDRGNSGGDRGRAVSRDGGSADRSRGAYEGGSTTRSTFDADRNGSRDRTPVPAYSRPRGGGNVIGEATPRKGTIPGVGGGYYPIYDPYYYYGYYDPYYYGYGSRSSRYWLPGYGFGLGYFGYDPFLFGGYYDPYSYEGQGGGSAYGYGQNQEVGALRLKVKPANAQVYVDGYFVGVTDSFDGMFQKLSIEAGSHRIEVRAEGYETVQFDVMVTPGETITYKGELRPIK